MARLWHNQAHRREKKGNEKGKPSVRWSSGSREIAKLHHLLVKLRKSFPFAVSEALLLSEVIEDATSPLMHQLPQTVNTEDYLEKKKGLLLLVKKTVPSIYTDCDVVDSLPPVLGKSL